MCHLKQLLLFALFLLTSAQHDGQNVESKVENITGKKGQPVKLHCGIEFDKNNFAGLWKNGSDFITAGETVMKYLDKIKVSNSGSDLEIINVQPEDAAIYTCSDSSSSATSHQYVVNVVYLENIQLEPKKPTLDLKAGSKLTLKCTADGSPKPMAKWFHNGRQIEKGEINDETGELIVDNMETKDAGMYECRLDNQSGDRLNKSILVNVLASAQVMKKPENGKVSVMSGDNVKLNCHVNGQGQMKIHWYFKGEQLNGKMGEELQLKNAQYSDAGQYKCKVMTEVYNNMEANFSVEVLHAPNIICNKLHIHTGEDRTVEIICFVIANPKPQVHWERHNHTLMPSNKISIIRDTSLMKYVLKIHKIKSTDLGDYFIVVSNDFGTTKERISLKGVPTPVIVTAEGDAGVNTTIKFSTKSSSPIFYFELKYRHFKDVGEWQILTIPGESSNIMFTQEYMLRCLQGGADYEMVMSAVNKFGQSEWGNVLRLHIQESSKNSDDICMPKDSMQAPSSSISSSNAASSSSVGSEAAAVESVPTSVPGSSTPLHRSASLMSILTIVILVIFFW